MHQRCLLAAQQAREAAGSHFTGRGAPTLECNEKVLAQRARCSDARCPQMSAYRSQPILLPLSGVDHKGQTAAVASEKQMLSPDADVLCGCSWTK